MNKSNYESVNDFHIAFGCEMPSTPTPISEELVLNRMGFDAEETIELLHATSDSPEKLKELYDKLLARMEVSLNKQLKKPFPKNKQEKLIAQVDACLDKRYFNSGDFTLMSVNPDPLFEIVHDCNMKKLWSDNKPRYNEHGKIIKPEGWIAPEPLLEKEINRQIKAAISKKLI